MPRGESQKTTSERPRTSRALLLILGVAVVGSTLAIAQRSDNYKFFDPLIEVKAVIDRFAVVEHDPDELQEAAIRGMLEALDDPYASYVPPSFNDEFEKQLTGEYVGIGAEVNQVDGVFTIVTPMDDSPAFRAGIMSGDKVIAIDGEPTEGETVDESIDRLLGEENTEVVLTVDRRGEILEITIVRARIKSRAVRGFRRLPDADASWDYMLDPERTIGYIRVSQFTPSVAQEFADALATLNADEPGALGGLVIDLRWNPGGLLDQAIRMADLLLDEGVIVSTNGRAYEERVARAQKQGTLPDFPVAVLVNGQSASASEVLAGALAENGRAIVVGERSFGKGSVQSIHPLGGGATGASLKLTEQRYYLPSGRSLQRTDENPVWGVDPTPGFFVPMDVDEIRALFEVRRSAEIVGGEDDEITEPSGDPAWIESVLHDHQLAAAVRAVRTRIEEGSWPEVEDAEAGAADVSVAELERLDEARNRMLRDLARVERRYQTLLNATGDDADRAIDDFWDDSVHVEGGTVVVRDASGAVLARLRVTGENLERWLLDADVELADEAGVEGEKPGGDSPDAGDPE